MNCREVQGQLKEATSYSRLPRSIQMHVEDCVECQGAYPTRPALRGLMFDALPDIEPDPRLLATVRRSIAAEMDRPPRRFFQFEFFPSLSFAAGVAVLFAVLALPLLWMRSAPQSAQAPMDIARAVPSQVQTTFASPFAPAANRLVIADSMALKRQLRPQIQPGSVVHVIYPFSDKPQPQRRVVHY